MNLAPYASRDRSSALSGGSSVDVLPVSDLEDSDRTSFIINEVDDSEVALPHSVAIGVTSQFLRSVRSGIGCERLNASYKSFSVGLEPYRGKFLARGGLDQNAI